MDELPEKDKQAFIDHFVKQMLGKPTGVLQLSKSFTISNSPDLEEEIRALASAYGIDHNLIVRADFKASKDAYEKSKIKVQEIIDSVKYKDSSGQRAKKEEIIAFAKFLYASQTEGSVTSTEEPDFILNTGSANIGVEHSRLTLYDERELFSIMQKEIIRPVEELVRKDIPTGLINLIIDVDVPVELNKTIRLFKSLKSGNTLSELRQSLAQYIVQFCKNLFPQKPAFLRQIFYQENRDPLFISLADISVGSPDFTELINKTIKKKEVKLERYRQHKGTEKSWLLIEFETSQFHSRFDIHYNNLTNSLNFMFDRIVLLNSTTLDCYEIFPGQTIVQNITKNGIPQLYVPVQMSL